MRLFLMLVVLLMMQYKTFGQEILIKEDFEFYWPLEQYDIQGDWLLNLPQITSSSSAVVGRSRALQGPFVFSISNTQLYDSIQVEVMYFHHSSVANYWNLPVVGGLEYSSDSIIWYSPERFQFENAHVWNCIIDTQTYPYVRIYTEYASYIDNLLVIGYTDTATSNCQYDANQDGQINAPDLIDFLSWYGTATVCD